MSPNPCARPSACSASGGFFSARKTTSENRIMRIYYKICTIMCLSKKTSVVRPSAWRPPAFFFQQKTISENIIMRIYLKIDTIMCFPKKTPVLGLRRCGLWSFFVITNFLGIK